MSRERSMRDIERSKPLSDERVGQDMLSESSRVEEMITSARGR